MITPEEKHWKLIQDYLFAESNGTSQPRFGSRQTLFGIKSEVEKTIERAVVEDEAAHAEARKTPSQAAMKEEKTKRPEV